MTRFVDTKVGLAPAVNPIKFFAILNRPLLFYQGVLSHLHLLRVMNKLIIVDLLDNYCIDHWEEIRSEVTSATIE
jgi:hypothetical protein